MGNGTARRSVAGAEHDDAAEQPLVDLRVHVMRVVVERPGAERVVGHVKGVDPRLARADRVGAAAVVGRLGAERPGAVGVDAVAQAVHVQRVRNVVGVPDVDLQPLARARVDDGPGTRCM